MEYYIGCSGYFYYHWKGKFYKEDAKPSEFFEYYTKFFNSVEINSTFYNFPNKSSIKRLDKLSPSNFKFSFKLNKTITHIKRFKGVTKDMERFHNPMNIIRSKLGFILIQLPPSLHKSIDLLKVINNEISGFKEFRYAIEFRHSSWWDEEVYEFLRSNEISFVSVDAYSLPRDIITTTNTLYLRFHGRDKRWYKYDYSERELKEIVSNIKGIEINKLYAYFNNDFNALAPFNALKFKKIISNAFM